ncbi:hypothetical protein OS493_038585 [Desmophyllum pertusum]|uniref:CUE domain-containing protein n=1 Tax=Desmophyllum pertusum TaxID=174260 RepID=A0A9W9ZYH3_9CNID|nr:hypothetical protein OS493_038585 [Desmophyllum pertusum]
MSAISGPSACLQWWGSSTATCRKEKRTEGIKQYCTSSVEVDDDREDPVNYLQQLFPDAARNDLEQALESCKGDANQAAEFLLQGNETDIGEFIPHYREVGYAAYWASHQSYC